VIDRLSMIVDEITVLLRRYGQIELAQGYDERLARVMEERSQREVAEALAEIRASIFGMGGLLDLHLSKPAASWGAVVAPRETDRDPTDLLGERNDNVRLNELADELNQLIKSWGQQGA
jgi:hypothetical protein